VQACGATQSEAHQLVDYVYGRPIGEPFQEFGGVMMTLAALCSAQRIDLHITGEVELSRSWTKVEKFQAKQVAKSEHSPLLATALAAQSGYRLMPIDPTYDMIDTAAELKAQNHEPLMAQI